MRRYLQSDFAWWASMMPAFLLATYFVRGWMEHRNDPSTLLSAIGTIAVGAIITCLVFARQDAVAVTDSLMLCRVADSSQSSTDCDKPCEPGQPEPAPAETEVPEHDNPWMAKGLSLATSKQWRDALYCFSYVLQSDPTNQAALTAKGECLMKMNRPEEALKAFMQAAHIDGDSPLAQEGKAALLRRVRAATWM